ncbi:hypothetical protein CG723_45155, partial [Streptomyces sp. CB01635]|uniref:transposase n=2 Tax=unclassified Streptomyces TaxID=2593676 RepID=UPI000CA66905
SQPSHQRQLDFLPSSDVCGSDPGWTRRAYLPGWVSWRDLPERYGPWQTVYTRFRRYAQCRMLGDNPAVALRILVDGQVILCWACC